MGVLRFFYWIYQQHPEILTKVYNDEEKNNFLRVDAMAIDLNSIVHPIIRSNTIIENKSIMHRGTTIINKTDEELYFLICEEISKRVSIINPKSNLLIAIDGVAGLSKMKEQKTRRMLRKYDGKGFDFNRISCGTEFMYNLSLYIQAYIKRQLKARKWSHLNIIFSSERVVGEGEHKLIAMIRKMNINHTYVIDSPDADLIFLTLGMLENNMYVFRSNSYDNVECDYFLVNINKLRDIICMLYLSKLKNNISNNEYIYRFIISCFFLGNDFIPRLYCLEIFNNGIEEIIDITSGISQPFLSFQNSIPTISLVNIREFFSVLSKMEWELIVKKYTENDLHNDKLYSSAKGSFNEYRRLHYKERLHIDNKCQDDVDRVCFYYLKTMQFVIQYYLKEIPDWEYCYPYYYPPFVCDLLSFLDRNPKLSFSFEKQSPLNPIEQLISILPYHSYYLLPEEYKKECEKYRDILEIIEVKKDIEGKKNDYEEIVLVPLTDLKIVKEISKKVKEKNYITHLTEPDYNKNYKVK